MKCFSERPVSLLVAIVVGGLLLVSCSSWLTPTATPTLRPRVESTLPLAELWCIQSETPISRPIFSEGLLFTLDGKKPKVTHRVYQANNGTLVWTGTSDNQDTSAGLPGYWLVHPPYLIVGGGDSITVLDASTGEFEWRIEPWLRGFATDEERLFVGSPEKIRAYELSSGDLLWEIEGQGRGWSGAPLYDPYANLLIFDEATYRLVDPENGSVIFETQRHATDNQYNYRNNGGQIHNGILFYVDEAIDVESNEIIHARSIAAYTQKWEPAIIDDIMLVSDYSQVVAFHVEEFMEVWHYDTPEVQGQRLVVVGDPIALDGIVYVILSDASIRALDLQTGDEIGMWQGQSVVDQRGRSTPIIPGFAVGDGMLFASFGTNELCAFGKP